MVTDLALCFLALLLASAADSRPFWQRETLLLQHPFRQILLAGLLVCCWHVSLVAVGAYHAYQLHSWYERAVKLAKSSLLITVGATIWAVLHVLVSGRNFVWTPEAAFKIFVFLCLTYTLLVASRVLVYFGMGWLGKHGRSLRHVLIVGSNQRALRVAEFLSNRNSLRYKLMGFADDTWHAITAPDNFRKMLIGGLADVPALLRTLALDEVVIALPIASHYASMRSISAECHKQGIIVRCEGSLFDLEGSRSSSAPPQMITLHERPLNEWLIVLKRLLDISVSFCILFLLLPVLVLVAAAIKLSSPGPVFFMQERLGLGKRRFKIFKFRTMVEGADKLIAGLEHLNESAGPTFKLKNDPRITPFGKFLRQTSLDELPQFINVLFGDMSLVGPRPLPQRDYQGFSEDWHRRRFSVKPGITCLWQIKGRSSIGFEKWMELDMNYIDGWSFWLDIKILAQTIPAVLRGSGAM